MSEGRDTPRQLIVFGIAVSALTLMVMWALYLARGVVLLVYVSALFAAGFSPLIRLIERQRLLPVGSRRFPRWLAILTLYFVIIGALVSVALTIIPPFVEQARELWARLPQMLDRAQTFLIERGLLSRRVTLMEAVQNAPGSSGDTVGAVFSAVAGFVGGVFGVVTILILTFYMLVESSTIAGTFVHLFPRDKRAHITATIRQITLKVSAWLNGQLILAGTIGTTAAIGLWVLGVPYFYVLALIAAIGETIPIVGPIFAAIPAVLVAVTVSYQKALAVIVFFFLQQQLENHILVPRIMSRQVGVSAVTVIVALLLGGSLLGIVGALLAVPTAAILQVLFQEFVGTDDSARK